MDLTMQWACLVCFRKCQFGALIARGDLLHCPTCHSPYVHPATGEVIVMDENIEHDGSYH